MVWWEADNGGVGAGWYGPSSGPLWPLPTFCRLKKLAYGEEDEDGCGGRSWDETDGGEDMWCRLARDGGGESAAEP